MLSRVHILQPHIAYLLFWAILFLLPCPSQSQELNRWKTYTTKDGMQCSPQEQLVQDGQGFLWTLYGLQRFDGYTFKTYNQDLHDSLGFPIDAMTTGMYLHVDDAGDLWIDDFENSRLCRYDFEKDGFVSYPLKVELPIESLAGNKSGLWIGTEEKGLFHFNPETGELQKYLNADSDSLNNLRRNSIHGIIDKGAYLVCVTIDGLWEFDKATKVFTRPSLSATDSAMFCGEFVRIWGFLPSGSDYWFWIGPRPREKMGPLMVKTNSDFSVIQKFDVPAGLAGGFAVDSRDVFWLPTKEKGLLRYDPASAQSTFYMNEPGNPSSLPANWVKGVIVDRNQNVWVSTPKGLSRLMKSADFHNYQLPDHANFTVGFGYIQGKTGNYLIAASQMALWTARFDRSALGSLQFHRLEIKDRPKDFGLISDIEKSNNAFWVVAGGSIFKLPINSQTGIPEGRIVQHLYHDPNNNNSINGWIDWSIQIDDQENLWMGTRNGNKVALDKVVFNGKGELDTVLHFRHDPANPNSLIAAKLRGNGGVGTTYPEDKNSRWVATTAGLDLLHGDGRFEHVLNNYCSAVKKAGDGTVLVSVFGQGLFEGRKKADHYQFTKVEALDRQVIGSIEEDRLGRLWIGTGNGLFLYNRKAQTVEQFTIDDGLQGDIFGRSTQTPEGIIAFATENGLTLLDPLSYHVGQTKPRPLITQLQVNNRPIRVKGHSSTEDDFVISQNIASLPELVLDYSHNLFSLEFAAMDLTSPEKNLYAYRLERINKDWVQTDWKNRTATYMNLDPGKYTFKVKATNAEGIWSDRETTLTIRVLPPPWKTWWAYSLYFILACGVLFISRRSIVLRERLKSNLRLEHLELEKAQEVDKMKSGFFANISHEFRTPITLILGPLKDLYNKSSSEEERNVLGVMMRNGQRLLRLINQLLDLSKLEAGKMTLQPTPVDLVQFLREISSSYESLAVDKRIKFFFYPEVPELILLIDQEKIEKVIHNLLSNAFKFTKENGEVILNLKMGERQCVIIVKDTGIGIPANQLDKVFDRFYQVDSSQTRGYEGSGLGMALAKELAELHKGKISVESKEGVGTTFTLYLPLGKEHLSKEEITDLAYRKKLEMVSDLIASNDTKTEIKVEEETISSDSKPVLLIVEDNADMRHYIRKTLSDQYQIIEAENGKTGVKMAQESVPDLIISDIMMPEMDGYKLCELIKTNETTSHVPVILLTAKADRESKLTGLETGADDYLSKPFDADELKLIVRNRIEERNKMKERFSREVTLEPRQISITSMDEKFITKILAIIEAHMDDENFSIDELSREGGYSNMHFYRKIKALAGQTPSQFLRTIRLKRAAELLSKNSDNVTQIAYSVGFSSLSYFNKCFKEQFGITPGQFAEAGPKSKV